MRMAKAVNTSPIEESSEANLAKVKAWESESGDSEPQEQKSGDNNA